MLDNKPKPSLWKPWRDGWVENTTKVCGVVLIFLFVSGLFGANYPKVSSNPYVWGLYVRSVFVDIAERF